MDVKFVFPSMKSNGMYRFRNTEDSGLTFHADEDEMIAFQRGLTEVTRSMIDYLEAYQMPDSVNGRARGRLVPYKVRQSPLPFPKTLGYEGFPVVHIDTDLGSSSAVISPTCD